MYSITSVQPLERERRRSSYKLIVKWLKTKKKALELLDFLCYEENKQLLVELMHTCWSEIVIEGPTDILVKESDVNKISPE